MTLLMQILSALGALMIVLWAYGFSWLAVVQATVIFPYEKALKQKFDATGRTLPKTPLFVVVHSWASNLTLGAFYVGVELSNNAAGTRRQFYGGCLSVYSQIPGILKEEIEDLNRRFDEFELN